MNQLMQPTTDLKAQAQLEPQKRPYYALYQQEVTVDGQSYKPGVWLHGIKHNNHPDSEGVPFDEWLCTPLSVEAETISTDDGKVGRLLRFYHHGKFNEWVMPMEAIAGSGEEVLKVLMGKGLTVNFPKRKTIINYIAMQQMHTIIETTYKTGWHKSGAFVLPNQVLGGNKVRYQDSGRAATIFSTQGTLEDWKKSVSLLCVGNPVLILSVCCALAGTLLFKVSIKGGGVHLVGDSSSGKSLAQEVAASVWGHPDSFAASWDVTKGGIEIEAASRNDTVLILDEIKRADPYKVQEMAYAIANGIGKSTMTREREGRAKLTWRVLALSSGERSLSEHAAIAGSPAHAGAELRMVDINAGTRTYKAFDYLHGLADGQQFHSQLTKSCRQHYGHAGAAMVEQLLKQTDDSFYLNAFTDMRKGFDAQNPQAGRVADRFAVMALAGELAIRYGVLSWPVGTAKNACQLLFNEWLATVGHGNSEDKQIAQALADFIAKHGDSRFSNIGDKFASIVHNRAGYYRVEDGKKLYLFNNAALKEAAQGYSLKRIIQTLEVIGALAMKDNDRPQKRFRFPFGGADRFIVIDPEKLE